MLFMLFFHFTMATFLGINKFENEGKASGSGLKSFRERQNRKVQNEANVSDFLIMPCNFNGTNHCVVLQFLSFFNIFCCYLQQFSFETKHKIDFDYFSSKLCLKNEMLEFTIFLPLLLHRFELWFRLESYP